MGLSIGILILVVILAAVVVVGVIRNDRLNERLDALEKRSATWGKD